ncbi:MAG: hypothetical protein PHV13_05545 [Candidatus ainarchaeum sp.]|nr:hypothetical protein [Candidatus ainarchaeum sp.]
MHHTKRAAPKSNSEPPVRGLPIEGGDWCVPKHTPPTKPFTCVAGRKKKKMRFSTSLLPPDGMCAAPSDEMLRKRQLAQGAP